MIYVMNFNYSEAEVQTSAVVDIMSTTSKKAETEESSNNAPSEEIDLQTSENPTSGNRVGNIEEIHQNTEVKTSENPTSRVRHCAEVQTSEFPTSGLLKNRSLEVGKTDSNNTNINNTEYSNINLSSKRER